MKLFPFQEHGKNFLMSHPVAILADEMGLGKTPQALAALDGLEMRVSILEGGKVPFRAKQSMLVVCPASLKLNWEREAKNWCPDHKISVLSGKNNFRFPEPGEIVIANYDILPAELPYSPSPFVVCADEAHMAKNKDTARTKRLMAIAQMADRVWLLTGTPLTNKPFDILTMTKILGRDVEIWGGWNGFLRLFGGYKNRWGGYDFGRVDHSVPGRLAPYMLRRLRKEVLPELPAKTYTQIPIELPKSIEKLLDELECDEKVAAELAADKLPPFETFSAVRAALAESRIKAALEIAENAAGEKPIVVFSAHRCVTDAFEKMEGWKTITGDTKPADRQAAVDSFQAGNLKGLALTIQAGGVGLTLTAADTVLFVDRSWTPAENSQAEDRVCRIGQTSRSINVIQLVSSHPLDCRVEKLLCKKAAVAAATLGDALPSRKVVVAPKKLVQSSFLEDLERIPC